MKTEAKVGIFVAIGLIFLFLLSTQVNRFAHFGKEGYIVGAYLNDIDGLEKNAKVKIKGVEVGYIKDISLEKNRVKTTLFIYKGIKIPKDSTVVVKQEGMLGNKYLSIIPGNLDIYLGKNEYLSKEQKISSFNEAANSIDEAAREFKEFIKELRVDMKGDRGDDLKKSVANLRDITESIKKVIEENRNNLSSAIINLNKMAKELASAGREFKQMSSKFSYSADTINDKLPAIMKKIDSLSSDLADVSSKAKKKLPDILDRFASLEKDLKDVIKENKKPLKNAISSADNFFSSGGSTFKKLDNYLEKIDKSQIEFNIRSEYMSDDGYAKSYANINYLPSPNKYYMLGVASGDDYSRVDSNGNLIPPKDHEDSKIFVSAQYGLRYDNFLYRLGVIENTGGVGVDYFMLNDRAKLTLEAFDFNGVNDVRGDSPHLKFLARYRFLKHLDSFVGVDNFLNSDATNFIFGVGVHFIDNDFKTVLGAASGAGTFVK